MKDLHVTVTVKNGLLLRAIDDAGYPSVAAFCRAGGLPYQGVIDYLALRTAPYQGDGQLRVSALRLSAFLGREIEALFPAAFLHRCLEKNRVEREISADELPALMAPHHAGLSYDPEHTLIAQEAVKELSIAMGGLAPKDRLCLAMFYGVDGQEKKTLDEIGAHFGVTRERIRQRVLKAERLLRHPSRDLRRRCAALLEDVAA